MPLGIGKDNKVEHPPEEAASRMKLPQAVRTFIVIVSRHLGFGLVKRLQGEYKNALGVSYGHLPGTLFHHILQKVKG